MGSVRPADRGSSPRRYGSRDVRRPRVVAFVALIAAFAAVGVPGSVGSQGRSPVGPIDPTTYHPVGVSWIDGTTTATPTLDPAYRSDGALTNGSILLEPDRAPAPAGRPDADAVQPDAHARVVAISPWQRDA